MKQRFERTAIELGSARKGCVLLSGPRWLKHYTVKRPGYYLILLRNELRAKSTRRASFSAGTVGQTLTIQAASAKRMCQRPGVTAGSFGAELPKEYARDNGD